MILDVNAVRLEGALHELGELRDPGHLILHVDQSLVAVAWTDLRKSFTKAPVPVGPPGKGRVLATRIAVDDAWTIVPTSQEILLARLGTISFLDSTHGRAVRTIKPNGLRNGTFGAALDGDALRALFIVSRDVSMDFAEYTVAAVDLTAGTLVPQTRIHGNADFELLWDEPSRSWVIGSTHTGSLWRWDGVGEAVKFDGPAGTLQGATFVADGEGVVISALTEDSPRGSHLITGRLGPDRVTWAEPVTLPGTSVILARRHPKRPLWACLAFDGAAQQIRICDAAGKVQAVAAVRPPGLLKNLRWSTSSPDRIWGLGVRTLAAATLIESADNTLLK